MIKAKKGIPGMEALVILIITIIAIYFLIIPLANMIELNKKNANQEIAQLNARTISDFGDYFTVGPYFGVDNCYNLLRIRNLELFQRKVEGSNFDLIISSEGVKVISHNEFQEFRRNNFDINSVNVLYRSMFVQEFNLYKDQTQGGGFISSASSGLSMGLLGRTGENIQKGNRLKYIVLRPKFSSGVAPHQLYGLNDFEIFEISENNRIDRTSSKSYLVIEKTGEEINLFVSANENSDSIVKRNLCSFSLLTSQDIDNFYMNNLREVDIFNRERILFAFFTDQGTTRLNDDYVYEIRNQNLVCNRENEELQEIDCAEIFDEDITERLNLATNPRNKINIIEDYYVSIRNLDGELRPVLLGDRLIRTDIQPLYFDQIFNKLNREIDQDFIETYDSNIFTFRGNSPAPINSIGVNWGSIIISASPILGPLEGILENSNPNRLVISFGAAPYFFLPESLVEEEGFYTANPIHFIKSGEGLEAQEHDFFIGGRNLGKPQLYRVHKHDVFFTAFNRPTNLYKFRVENVLINDDKIVDLDILFTLAQINQISHIRGEENE